MALTANTVLRVGEARTVLDAALAAAPDARARAAIIAQHAWVASKQGHVDEVLARVAEARRLLAATVAPGTPPPAPAVLDAVVADAMVRANRWAEAVEPARTCAERAPKNAAAWASYARVLVAVGDHPGALAAAVRGLHLSPRDPDLLRAQATALAALDDPRAAAAQAAYTRFRAPDDAAALRIRCARGSDRCMRDRNATPTLALRP
jgi:tetratricopeptide (TPR) repeat protein